MISHRGNPHIPDSDPPLFVESSGAVKKAVTTLALIGVFVGLAVLGWYAVDEARNPKDLADVPLIKADLTSFKVEPEDPGGMDIPFKDRKVFDAIAPDVKDVADNTVKQIAVPQKSESTMAEVAAALKPEENSVVKNVVVDEPKKAEVTPALRSDEMKKVVKEAAPAKVVEPVVKKQPQAAPTPSRSATSGRYMIQLGSYRSEAGARKAWGGIQTKFATQLKTLSSAVKRAELGTKGTFYRLYAGPFDSREVATGICKTLSKRQQGCIVAQP